ncbi:cytokinin dehydrogenase 3-like protein [Tanacetum coccineum]
MDTTFGFGLSTESDDTMNEDTPVIIASAIKEGVTPSVVDMMVEKDKLSSLEDTTVSGSFPPLFTSVSTTANAPGKSSCANTTSKPSGKKVNVRTLFTPGGNGINVVVPIDSFWAISELFANTAYNFFLGKKVAYPVVANYVRNTWGKYGLNNPLILKKWNPDENLLKEYVSTVPVWVNLHGVPVTAFSEDGLSAIATKLTDVKLKDNIVMAMPKITREGHYTCNVCFEYEWKPPRCSSCKVFRHVHEECTMNTGAGEKKTVKKPSQTSRGVLIGLKWVLNLKKNIDLLPKSLLLVLVFGTNGGTNNEATSNGSSFMNIYNNGECASNTPIGAKIEKIERQIGEGKLRLLDNDGNPLVPTGIMESDSEVELVFLETANLGILTSGKDGSDKGYGTNCLLEQWRDSYPDNDDYDPYDDDMYENHDFSEHLQSICDDIDITVRGRKKK